MEALDYQMIQDRELPDLNQVLEDYIGKYILIYYFVQFSYHSILIYIDKIKNKKSFEEVETLISKTEHGPMIDKICKYLILR